MPYGPIQINDLTELTHVSQIQPADNFWQNMQSMFPQKMFNRKIPIQGSLHNLGALTTLGLCSMKFIIQWLGLRSHPPYTSHVLSSSQWSLPWKPFEFSTPSPNPGAIPQGSFQIFINYFPFHWYLIVLEIVTICRKIYSTLSVSKEIKQLWFAFYPLILLVRFGKHFSFGYNGESTLLYALSNAINW